MELSSWLIIAYTLTVLGVIGTVLSENRNPLKASAWILIVGLIPVFGIMVYIVFGQDQKRLNSSQPPLLPETHAQAAATLPP